MYVHDKLLLYGHDRKVGMKKGTKKENGKVKRIYLRTTELEYKEIMEKARKNNMNMSEFILYLVKKSK